MVLGEQAETKGGKGGGDNGDSIWRIVKHY